MKENKIILIIEILIVIAGLLYLLIRDEIPSLKKEYEGSAKLINVKEYNNMYEFNIDNKNNFILVLNKKNIIYHIFFLDNNSVVLYDKGIENKELKESIKIVIEELIKNNYIKTNSKIEITRYNDEYYENFKKVLINNLNKYNINNNIIEKTSNLDNIKQRLNLNGNSENILLREIDFYSKEVLYNGKNTIKNDNDNTDTDIKTIDSYRKMCNNIYKKIENYVYQNNDIETLPITVIPADKDGKYYASDNSWYKVKDGKVYAYIEIIEDDKKYGFCYEGSIDNIKEGEC